MKIKNKYLILFNLICIILLIIPVFWLNPFNENYSTLSLDTKGYFYLLTTGLSCGILSSYEYYHTLRKYWYLGFISFFMGCIIPHHVPYDFQGNMHLLFSYTGFGLMMISTLLNIYMHNEKTILNIISIVMIVCVYLIYRYMMVTTLCELFITLSVLIINMYIYLKYTD
ncbi:MAG: hypothetical protein Q4D13_03860 [Erysipelotrichaceae bacterium]|nr:hypothetical protein [Erysipelotrichaceae bacterium]